MIKYKVGYTKDQLRYTPACALDSKIPIRAAKELLTKEADEICSDNKFRFGESYVSISGFEIEIEGKEKDVEKVLSQLKKNWEVKRI